MRVSLPACGSRVDVEPLVGLAVRLRALGAEVRVCVPQDCAERLAASVRVNHTGSSSQDPEHENLQTLVT